MKTFELIAWLIGGLFFTVPSFAQETSTINSRLIPNTRQSNFSSGFGVTLTPFVTIPANKKTHDLYGPVGYGLALGVQKHVFGPWSGVLEGRLGNMMFPTQNMGPLSFFSKIEFAPTPFFWRSFEPYITAGLGYSFIFDDKSLFHFESPSDPGEMASVIGIGVRAPLSSQVAVKIGYDYQRSLQSSQEVEHLFLFGLILGDVRGFSK